MDVQIVKGRHRLGRIGRFENLSASQHQRHLDAAFRPPGHQGARGNPIDSIPVDQPDVVHAPNRVQSHVINAPGNPNLIPGRYLRILRQRNRHVSDIHHPGRVRTHARHVGLVQQRLLGCAAGILQIIRRRSAGRVPVRVRFRHRAGNRHLLVRLASDENQGKYQYGISQRAMGRHRTCLRIRAKFIEVSRPFSGNTGPSTRELRVDARPWTPDVAGTTRPPGDTRGSCIRATGHRQLGVGNQAACLNTSLHYRFSADWDLPLFMVLPISVRLCGADTV